MKLMFLNISIRYFNRDVNCIRTFFKKRFDFEAQEWPKFSDAKREELLDIETAASGYIRKLQHEAHEVPIKYFNSHCILLAICF